MQRAVRVACILAAVSVITGEALAYSCVGWHQFPRGLGFGSLLVAFFGLSSAFLVALPTTLVLFSLGKADANRVSALVIAVWVACGPLLAYLCALRPLSTFSFPVLM